MTNEIELNAPPPPRGFRGVRRRAGRRKQRAPVTATLPAGLVMSERAVGVLTRFLRRRGLADYRVWYCSALEVEDAEKHLEALGEADATWQPLGAGAAGGRPMAALTHTPSSARLWPTGALHLRRHRMVLARWYWVDETGTFRALWLAAAPSTEDYLALRDAVRVQRRRDGARKWQIIRNPYQGSTWVAREEKSADGLLLATEMRRRIEAEIVGFFSAEVAELYRNLRVPYRRGVLLHGPPGNGKTSIIRLLGALLSEVPMLVLRPSANFDTDDLEAVLKRWATLGPAVLIIEDLDWLLKEVNVSAFLNALDGVDGGERERLGGSGGGGNGGGAGGSDRGGLLLVATTNHPEKLDPAVNNRPGRFDVVIEVAHPTRPLRREFFARRLAEPAELVDRLAEATDGLSFAHLQEILRASGLAAIHAGRPQRSEADLLAAVASVRQANDAAERGFPVKLEVPFGLVPRRGK